MTVKLIHSLTWGEKVKENKSFKDKVNELIRKSEMTITATRNEAGVLNWLFIEITGELSKIPSIKNNMHSRFMFLRKPVLARLKAMDLLFREATKDKGKLSFEDEEVLVCLMQNKHARADNISAMETVQDWLEPGTKQKGGKLSDRGWGIGVIEDDRQAIPFSLTTNQASMLDGYTYILLIPFNEAKESTVKFIADLFIMVGGENDII